MASVQINPMCRFADRSGLSDQLREQRDFARGMFGGNFESMMAGAQAVLKAYHAERGGSLLRCATRLAREQLRAGQAPTPIIAAAVELLEGKDHSAAWPTETDERPRPLTI